MCFFCVVDAADFTRRLEKADISSCTWYLEDLKVVRPSTLCALAPLLTLTHFCVLVPGLRRPLLNSRQPAHLSQWPRWHACAYMVPSVSIGIESTCAFMHTIRNTSSCLRAGPPTAL